MAIEDPSSHIVASIHSSRLVAQIEEKLLRIFIKEDEESYEEKWRRWFRLACGMESLAEASKVLRALTAQVLSLSLFFCFFFAFFSFYFYFFSFLFFSLSVYPLSTWVSLLLARGER